MCFLWYVDMRTISFFFKGVCLCVNTTQLILVCVCVLLKNQMFLYNCQHFDHFWLDWVNPRQTACQRSAPRCNQWSLCGIVGQAIVQFLQLRLKAENWLWLLFSKFYFSLLKLPIKSCPFPFSCLSFPGDAPVTIGPLSTRSVAVCSILK